MTQTRVHVVNMPKTAVINQPMQVEHTDITERTDQNMSKATVNNPNVQVQHTDVAGLTEQKTVGPTATSTGAGVYPEKIAATCVPLAAVHRIHVSASDNEDVVASPTSDGGPNEFAVDSVNEPLTNTTQSFTHVPPAHVDGRTERTNRADNQTEVAEPKTKLETKTIRCNGS